MKTKKPSEVFEGENSSLRKTFDEATKKSNKECCEKCENKGHGSDPYELGIYAWYCNNKSCPCHQQPEKAICRTNQHIKDDMSKKEEKTDIFHPELKEKCVVCDPNWKGKQPLPLCEKHEEECLHPEPSRESWEEEFDEKFGIYSNYADFCPDKKEYKEFISQLLFSERTALVEEIKREAEYFRNNLSTENLNEEYEQFINLLTKKK